MAYRACCVSSQPAASSKDNIAHAPTCPWWKSQTPRLAAGGQTAFPGPPGHACTQTEAQHGVRFFLQGLGSEIDCLSRLSVATATTCCLMCVHVTSWGDTGHEVHGHALATFMLGGAQRATTTTVCRSHVMRGEGAATAAGAKPGGAQGLRARASQQGTHAAGLECPAAQLSPCRNQQQTPFGRQCVSCEPS